MMKPRVILIFGEPDNGKSWLANALASRHGYDIIHIDEVYLEFIRESYPKLYLESLNIVVSQHYEMILKRTCKGAEKAWAQHIVNVITERLNRPRGLAVEGYLLAPILKTVRAKLSKVAYVSTVYVKDRRYFASTTIKAIAGS